MGASHISPIPDTTGLVDESHPTDFIVEGKDSGSGVWRRLFVHADTKNDAIELALDRGVEAHTVREAHPEERPKTGIDAPQREFGAAGVFSIFVGVLGAVTIPFALALRGEMPTFSTVTAIAGAALLLYGACGTLAFLALHLHNRKSRAAGA